MSDSLPRTSTYFSRLFGFGYLLAGLFVLAFYLVCFLVSKRHIAAADAAVLLTTYWAASTLYFAQKIHGDFRRFYKATLRRMRRYSTRRILLQWYLGFAAVFILPLSLILANYTAIMQHALVGQTIKLLIAGYGISLFSVVFVGTIVCNVIAVSRGTAAWRAPRSPPVIASEAKQSSFPSRKQSWIASSLRSSQ